MPNVVLSRATLTPGIRADFVTAYDQRYRGMYESLKNCMDLEKPSDKRFEIYAYYKSAPYPERWPRGKPIPRAAFDAVQFQVANLKWGKRIDWEREDEEDDQLGGLFPRVRQVGANFATLDERVFFQILLGQTNKKLLPVIPNAPDGVGLFSALDGDSAARFGVTGGNILSGSGVSEARLVRYDIYKALMRAAAFLDTEGEPLWGESIVDGVVTLVYGLHNDDVVRTAVEGGLTATAIQNVGKTDNVAGAAIMNTLVGGNFQFKRAPSPRITDDKIRVFLGAAPHKPVFVQNRTPVEEHIATADTSDQTRDLDIGYVTWRARKGYGIFLPYGAVLIDN